ncbi:hypothetical protein G5714_011569 [Onychostoma macrolepis]|uniref:Uncharacterized protein n=1 Tax=Onychostoma macrolepis TaxID=369639 RepID=A0A7J6CKW6_9TELE|nr:hypothetical protein G5714_011569 [Onychostoma macrolepis]
MAELGTWGTLSSATWGIPVGNTGLQGPQAEEKEMAASVSGLGMVLGAGQRGQEADFSAVWTDVNEGSITLVPRSVGERKSRSMGNQRCRIAGDLKKYGNPAEKYGNPAEKYSDPTKNPAEKYGDPAEKYGNPAENPAEKYGDSAKNPAEKYGKPAEKTFRKSDSDTSNPEMSRKKVD